MTGRPGADSMQGISKLLRKARTKLGRGGDFNRELNAYHEAAHIVVSWAHGLNVERVTLDRAEASAANETFVASVKREVGTWIENARVSVAGRLADCEFEDFLAVEFQFDTHGGLHNDDAAFMANLLESTGGDKEKARALAEAAIGETQSILDRYRNFWNVLAVELHKRGSMEAPEIVEILGPLPEVDDKTKAERRAVNEAIGALAP
ncbi:MAG: hypothetical protein F9K18_01160 [Thermoanaerobaculia bacterium]|nr:MAG: hypothetical protein F9K18_01160 [Thermoanaerobaculia bacterium]